MHILGFTGDFNIILCFWLSVCSARISFKWWMHVFLWFYHLVVWINYYWNFYHLVVVRTGLLKIVHVLPLPVLNTGFWVSLISLLTIGKMLTMGKVHLKFLILHYTNPHGWRFLVSKRKILLCFTPEMSSRNWMKMPSISL